MPMVIPSTDQIGRECGSGTMSLDVVGTVAKSDTLVTMLQCYLEEAGRGIAKDIVRGDVALQLRFTSGKDDSTTSEMPESLEFIGVDMLRCSRCGTDLVDFIAPNAEAVAPKDLR
jgi:hypothetical protein